VTMLREEREEGFVKREPGKTQSSDEKEVPHPYPRRGLERSSFAICRVPRLKKCC
jgi:hypothetical protein